MTLRVCVFDAYGTLFDVAAAARRAASEPEQSYWAKAWSALAEDWRLKQLQYSWLRAITGDHCEFWQITCDALDWAPARQGLADDQPLRNRLLSLYRELDAYPEVPATLDRLKSAGLETAILSNGSPDMLDTAVASAGLGPSLDAVLSVEEVVIFKPARAVYDMVGARFDVAASDVLFVSSNGWDAAGAAAYGFTTVWVNRNGDPVDRLPGTPHHQLTDLTRIPDLAGV